MVSCQGCLDNWVAFYRNNHKMPPELYKLIDLNANNEEKCKACGKPLPENDRMIGGDGKTGCDMLPWRYHNHCFYSRFGYID